MKRAKNSFRWIIIFLFAVPSLTHAMCGISDSPAEGDNDPDAHAELHRVFKRLSKAPDAGIELNREMWDRAIWDLLKDHPSLDLATCQDELTTLGTDIQLLAIHNTGKAKLPEGRVSRLPHSTEEREYYLLIEFGERAQRARQSLKLVSPDDNLKLLQSGTGVSRPLYVPPF